METPNKLQKAESTQSLANIIQTKNNIELINFCSEYSIEKCLYESKNQLSKIKREQGEKEAIKQIMYLISWTNNAFKNNLTDDLIYEVSLTILKDYWSYKLEDIALFCSLLRKGELGKIYNLEMQTIFELLKKYDQKRADAAYKKHYENKEIGSAPRSEELTEAQKLSGIVKLIDKSYE